MKIIEVFCDKCGKQLRGIEKQFCMRSGLNIDYCDRCK